MDEIDATNTGEITCPYCGFEYGDSQEFLSGGEEDDIETCEECGKKFHWSRSICVDYNSKKLCEENNDEHNWEEFDVPKDDERPRCKGRRCLTCKKYEFDKEQKRESKKNNYTI